LNSGLLKKAFICLSNSSTSLLVVFISFLNALYFFENAFSAIISHTLVFHPLAKPSVSCIRCCISCNILAFSVGLKTKVSSPFIHFFGHFCSHSGIYLLTDSFVVSDINLLILIPIVLVVGLKFQLTPRHNSLNLTFISLN